jgi:outer membrane protein assembly factor BamE
MRPTLPTLFLLAALLAGCNLLYKPEIQQGTLLSAEMLANLKPDMTRRQVRLLLGSPPVSDTFHPERWDYVYSVNRAGEKVTPQHLTLYFRNDTLVRAEGDLAPAALVEPANGNAAPAANGTMAPR